MTVCFIPCLAAVTKVSAALVGRAMGIDDAVDGGAVATAERTDRLPRRQILELAPDWKVIEQQAEEQDDAGIYDPAVNLFYAYFHHLFEKSLRRNVRNQRAKPNIRLL